MEDLINVSKHKCLSEDHKLPGRSAFKNLFDVSVETGISEAEIVSRCGGVWMDCGLNWNDACDGLGVEHRGTSSWLGLGSVSGKRAMPLWCELTKDSLNSLVNRLRQGNHDLRGLSVSEANCLWEEDVKLLSFNELDLDVELLGCPDKYLPDQPILYVEKQKLEDFLGKSAGQPKPSTAQGMAVGALDHTLGNKLAQHAEFYEEHHHLEPLIDQSYKFRDAYKQENADSSSSFEPQTITKQPLRNIPGGKHSGFSSHNPSSGESAQLCTIPEDALLKLKAPWPMENLYEAFRAMIVQGWVDDVPKGVLLEHFTNSLLKVPVSHQTPKINWLGSKVLLHAVMKNLEIPLTDVHEHFLHRGGNMTPIRSGLKFTEYLQVDKVRELFKKFRP